MKRSSIVSLFNKKWLVIACNEFVVVDIETTGLSKHTNYIIEVAAIRYRDCVEVDKLVTLINPGVSIPSGATAIHGITDQMVADSPTIEVVMPQLLDFLVDSLLVGHCVSFDLGFIEVWASRLGYSVKWNYVDTRSVARKLLKGLPNYKQVTILDCIGYKQSSYHRAEDDCRGCAEIMKLGVNSLVGMEDAIYEC